MSLFQRLRHKNADIRVRAKRECEVLSDLGESMTEYKTRAAEAQAVIEELAEKWRVDFEIEDIIGHFAEQRSYQRILDCFERGFITEETARRCIALLDEAL